MDKPKTTSRKTRESVRFLNKIQMKFLELGSFENLDVEPGIKHLKYLRCFRQFTK